MLTKVKILLQFDEVKALYDMLAKTSVLVNLLTIMKYN